MPSERALGVIIGIVVLLILGAAGLLSGPVTPIPTLPAKPPAAWDALMQQPAGTPFSLALTSNDLRAILLSSLDDPTRSPLTDLRVTIGPEEIWLSASLRGVLLWPIPAEICLRPDGFSASTRPICRSIRIGRLRVPACLTQWLNAALTRGLHELSPLIIEQAEAREGLLFLAGRRH